MILVYICYDANENIKKKLFWENYGGIMGTCRFFCSVVWGSHWGWVSKNSWLALIRANLFLRENKLTKNVGFLGKW